MAHTSRIVEYSGAEINVDNGRLAQEISEGKILVSGLETFLVLLWQRMWLLFALVLIICLRLNRRVLD